MLHPRGRKDGSAVHDMIRVALAMGPSACLMHRLDCVLLIAEGRSVSEVADWFGVGKRSVQRWVHAADASGIDGLLEHRKGGRPASLSHEQGQSLSRDLLASPSAFGYRDRQWSGKRLALHLEERYAIKISVRTCQRMVSRSRIGLATPR